MTKYPPDEFDSIVPSGRKGAHRRQSSGMSQTAAISLIAVLAVVAVVLVIGAVRIIGSSAVDPEEQVAGPGNSETATPEPSETSVNVKERSGTVQVLNASGVTGADKTVAKKIEDAGWSDVKTELGRSSSSTSVVYYADGFKDEAQDLAEVVGAEDVKSSAKYSTDITLLLNSDIAKGLASDEPSAEATDEVSEISEEVGADE